MKQLYYNANIFYQNRLQFGALLVEDGNITAIEADATKFQHIDNKTDLAGKYLIPGFIDSHIHGIGGYSFQNQSSQDVLEASQKLASYGVTSFIPTISRSSSQDEEIIGDIQAIVNAKSKESGAKILGIHLEGPFLSLEKRGGQSAAGITPINLNLMKKLWEASQGQILTMTVAPELDKLEELVAFCKDKDIKLQTGHSAATYEQMAQAARLGLKHITHTFNAVSGLHHRYPGIIGYTLENDDISCELIADGYHVVPPVVKILFKCKPDDKIMIVTDAQKYSKTGINKFSENNIEYRADDYIYRAEDHTLVGSNISMLDGFQNLIHWKISLERAIMATSCNIAKYLNLNNTGKIELGYCADFIILNSDFSLDKTIINGQEVSASREGTKL